jgi:hypothetical protein
MGVPIFNAKTFLVGFALYQCLVLKSRVNGKCGIHPLCFSYRMWYRLGLMIRAFFALLLIYSISLRASIEQPVLDCAKVRHGP